MSVEVMGRGALTSPLVRSVLLLSPSYSPGPFFFMWIQIISPNQRTRYTMYFTSLAQHISYTKTEESAKVKTLAYL